MPRAYHGTTRAFDAFDPAAPLASGSLTATFGTFFSTSAPIAEHFTLKPEVVDAGYDTEEGSRSLVRDPWRFDPAPFQANARVIAADVILQRPLVMDALAWMALVDQVHSTMEPDALVRAWRQSWEAAGHDGLLISAWDGQCTDADGVTPSVETDADTYVVFDARPVQILGSQPADACWERATPTPRRHRPR
jgi:hypothetical protein